MWSDGGVVDEHKLVTLAGSPFGRVQQGQEEKGRTEDEVAAWHHRLEGHEFE